MVIISSIHQALHLSYKHLHIFISTMGAPSLLQQQHRAFMKMALNRAPHTLSPKERMSWAAEAWQRQKGKSKGGKAKRGKGIGSTLLKLAPYVLKAAKLGAKVGSKLVNQNEHPKLQAALDILGGKVKGRRKKKTRS
jgi:hypothetical protein